MTISIELQAAQQLRSFLDACQAAGAGEEPDATSQDGFFEELLRQPPPTNRNRWVPLPDILQHEFHRAVHWAFHCCQLEFFGERPPERRCCAQGVAAAMKFEMAPLQGADASSAGRCESGSHARHEGAAQLRAAVALQRLRHAAGAFGGAHAQAPPRGASGAVRTGRRSVPAAGNRALGGAGAAGAGGGELLPGIIQNTSALPFP